MKTIDTSKLWTVNPATESVVPEICGPHGICMDVHGASTEQAQEIAGMLNPMQGVGVEARLAEFKAPYTATMRAGDCDATYSGPDAAGVIEMIRAAEHRIESKGPEVVLNITGDAQNAAQTLAEALSRGLPYDESTKFVQVARDPGKPDAGRGKTIYMLNARIQQLVAERDALKLDLAAAIEKFDEADHQQRGWESSAASYLRSMHWYQEQLDICGRAIGTEAFTCDDGGLSHEPLRAKVAELVVKLCEEQHLQRNTVIEECAKFLENGRFLTNDSPTKLFADEAAQAMRRRLKRKNRIVNADMKVDRMMNSDLTPEPRTEHDVTAIKRGPCAKQTVTATIITPTGERFVGTNDCLNPQTTCPRDVAGMKTGEGYYLCKQVCEQTGHAEINALLAAGEKAKGARMVITGHTYACEPCKTAAERAGLLSIEFGALPTQFEPSATAEELEACHQRVQTHEVVEDRGDLPQSLRQLAENKKDKYAPMTIRMLNKAADELQRKYEQTSTALGVGDGNGSLFVYGSYDAIKAAQRRVLRSTIPDISTLRHAFRYLESGNGKYSMILKFKNLDDLHRAAKQFQELDAAADRDGE